ncbi:MFS sugar transporter-like protein [Trichodelitschia bisporula]|uniref:MFS sugar transporter-like protein n=1 Tax=Trichodelitschia bisporula TaxID=703511 RepID=A0A6G1I059_9PEZI|nr:MFS sugar transporter-like protein [Trichodelitschia bisporula]
MGFPKVYNTYFLAIVSTIGGMLFGFDISSMAAIVGTDQYIWYFNNPHGVTQGAIGSALAAGSVIGALMAGPISDKYGRRDSIAFACIWWLIGTAVQVSTKGVGQLIAGRILNGVCVGITSSQVPVYLAEIAKKDKRGSIVVIQQLAIEFGILVMYFVGYGCSFIGSPKSTTSFRTAWGIQFVPAALLLMGLPFLPRSPRWLAKVGRKEEAIDVLSKIQAGGNRADPLVVAELQEIETVLIAERAGAKGWRRFIDNGMWRRTFAGMSVQAWQQLSGANVMVYYMVYVFSMAGLHGNINLISSGIQYALFIIFTVFTFFFIDRTGRRPLLIYGAIGMGVCHFVVGGILGTHGKYTPGGVDGNLNVVISLDPGAASHTVIAFSYLLIIIYALTLAPVAWVYAAEVWSLETRAYGMALASIANWLFNFALGLFVPPAFRNISWKTFIIFGVLCFGAAAQAFVSYPETAGKSLEEIEEMFRPGGPKPWKTRVGDSHLEAKVEEVREQQEKAGVVEKTTYV